MTNREILIDVMNDVDPKFIKEHMEKSKLTTAQKILRYAIPVAMYAAACVAVLLMLPYITGHTPDEPPVNDPVDPIVIETNATEPDETTETEETYVTDVSVMTETEEITESETAYTQTEIPETTQEIILPPEPIVPETIAPVPADTAESIVTAEPKPVTTTTTQTTLTTEPEPEGMKHITDGEIPYSYVMYESGHIPDEMLSVLSTNPVYYNAEEFSSFIDKIYKFYEKLPENSHSPFEREFIQESKYFNEDFFKEYNLCINQITEGSGSIYHIVDSVNIDDSGRLCVNINIYEPSVQTGDMNYIMYLFAVKKEYVQSTSKAVYSYDTYIQTYNYYTGENEYILDTRLPEGVMTYTVKKYNDKLSNDNIGVPIVMKQSSDLVEFRNKVSDSCDGNTETVLDYYYQTLVDNAETTTVFEQLDYVYIGIYDSDYIYDNGGIDITLSESGVMEIFVPVPKHAGTENSGRPEMYVLRFSKNILEGTKEIKIVEQASTKPETKFAVCSKCDRKCEADKVWASSVHPDYKQNGYIILFVKEAVTREIFKQSPDTTEIVMEKYLSGLELDKMSSSNYSVNLGLVDDIINGRHKYALPISFTLSDKSPENITKILSDFGCYYCSDFKLGGAIYG